MNIAITPCAPEHYKYLCDCTESIDQYIDKHKMIISDNWAKTKNEMIQDCNDDDYLFFLDADDIAKPYFVEMTKKELDKGADVVYGDCEYLLKDGSIEKSIRQPFNRDELRIRNYISNAGIAIRAGIAKKCRYDDTLPIAIDWHYWNQIAQFTSQFVYIPEILVTVRKYSSTYKIKNSKIPVYRKLRRKYLLSKTRRKIEREISSQ